VALQVRDLGQHGHAFGQQRFVTRTVAEVRGDGIGHFVEPALQCGMQAAQVVQPLRRVGLARLPRLAQPGQGGHQLGGRGGGRAGVARCGWRDRVRGWRRGRRQAVHAGTIAGLHGQSLPHRRGRATAQAALSSVAMSMTKRYFTSPLSMRA
jgi:hypothetical protein